MANQFVTASRRLTRLFYFQVDKMAARTKAIWMSARYLQNGFAPINRLPPEILGLIPSSFRSKRDLINATAVCRHWRNTLLSSPDLWSDVDCSGNMGPFREYMFRECLERSRNVPLNVRLTSVRYLPDMTPHLLRFASLEIQLSVPEQLGKITAYFSQPAPILRKLSVVAAAPWDRAGLSIPPGLFGGELAALRSLRLTGFSVLKIPHHFPHLTRFDLQTREYTSFGIDGILQVLERMPSLEVLHVRFSSTHELPLSPVTNPRLVTLSKLKEVELSSFDCLSIMPPCMPSLLFALTLPSVERVAIGMLPPLDSLALPGSFEEQLPNFAETTTVNIHAGTGIFKISFHGRGESRLFLFTNYCGVHSQFSRRGFRGMPFLSVKKLVVTVERFSPGVRGDLFGLLRAMERLEYLEIRGCCVHKMLSYLSERSKLDQQTICPSLQRLVVAGRPHETYSQLLAEFMEARVSRGAPLIETVEASPGMEEVSILWGGVTGGCL